MRWLIPISGTLLRRRYFAFSRSPNAAPSSSGNVERRPPSPLSSRRKLRDLNQRVLCFMRICLLHFAHQEECIGIPGLRRKSSNSGSSCRSVSTVAGFLETRREPSAERKFDEITMGSS